MYRELSVSMHRVFDKCVVYRVHLRTLRRPEYLMRLKWNSYSEWAPVRRERSQIMIVLVACAIGAVTSTAVILSLGDFPRTHTGVPPISPRPIVRNVTTVEPTTQDRPIESAASSTVISIGSSRDEQITQPEAEHQGEVHSQQSRQDRHQRSRESHWPVRFAHRFWRSTRFNSPRDALTSGVR